MTLTVDQVLELRTPQTRDQFNRLAAKCYKDALDERDWGIAREAGMKLYGLRREDVDEAIEHRKNKTAP